MGMTMAEKVLARASGQEEVQAGQYVTAVIDRMMCHDAFAVNGLTLKGMGVKKLFDPDRVVVIVDHYFPAPTERMAQGQIIIRQMVEEFKIRHYLGFAGICHQVMCEEGFVLPGQLILGTDSHTTTYGALGAASAGIGVTEMNYVLATGELWMQVPPTIRFELTGTPGPALMSKDLALYIAGRFGTEVAQYRAVEFCGPIANQMSIAGRMTLSNMGVEIGAKFAFFEADQRTLDYLQDRTRQPISAFGPDPDASYEERFLVDISGVEPQVSTPHNPGNAKSISQIEKTIIHQAFLGSCTNGRLEDLEVAAKILKGHQVNSKVRLLVTPASRKVLIEANKAGYIQILLEAGAHITPTGCGPCPGGHMGLIGPGRSLPLLHEP